MKTSIVRGNTPQKLVRQAQVIMGARMAPALAMHLKASVDAGKSGNRQEK